jgi:hypothetical protein
MAVHDVELDVVEYVHETLSAWCDATPGAIVPDHRR